MGRLEEIKARIRGFDAPVPEDLDDDAIRAGRTAYLDYWENIEDDLRWCVEELAKFHKCSDIASCTWPDGLGVHDVLGDYQREIYHKEDE